MQQILKGIACFLPILFLVMAVNAYADPGNAIRSDYEQKVAQIMAQGNNAENVGNMDDRALMRAYLPLRTQPIDTLVLGSSHSMQLTKELIGDENAFTAGMTGADLRDVISMYRLVKENGFAPKRVLIVADSWFLSEGVQEKRAMTKGYLEFCEDYGLAPIRVNKNDLFFQNLEKKMQIFSISYFQSSLNYLSSGQYRYKDPQPTTLQFAKTNMRRADGTYAYSEEYRNTQSGYAEKNVADMKAVTPFFASHFDGISDQLVKQMEVFLEELKKDGVEVAMMLAPFHPEYYAFMQMPNSGYKEVLSTQAVFEQMAQKAGIPLFGSYDPAECGLIKDDFYDGLHASAQAMEKFYPKNLFKSLK